MSVLPDSEDTLARSGFLRRPNPITTFLAGGGRNDAQCRTFGTDTSDRWRPARAIAIGGLIILIATGASAAMLRDEVPLGDLMCRLQDAGAVAAPSVQVYEIACVYRPAEGGIEEHYTGTLSAVGADDP